MKMRYCDVCGDIIASYVDYHKVCFLKHEGKKQTLSHSGDVCISCWEKSIKVKS